MSLTRLNLDRCSAITEGGVHQVYGKLSDLKENARFHLRLPDKALAYRALAGKVPTPIKEWDSQLLHTVVWPAKVSLENEEVCQRLLDTWHVQGLAFADPPKVRGGDGRFQFGLIQHRNGPCGILAAVQAELLRELVWPEIEEDDNVDHQDWDTLEEDVLREVSTKCLVTAVSEIIWRARPDKDAVAKIVLVDEELSHPLAYDSLEVVDCGSKEQVSAMVRGVLDIFTKPGGVILLLYSVVLTRGCHKVWEEGGNASKLVPRLQTDDETQDIGGGGGGIVQTLVVMEGDWPFCEQTLVNLFLIGQATVDLDPKCKCKIGFLTYMENLRPADVTGDWTDPTVVGTNYKTPTSPIWVVHGGSHYTVLIARSKGLLKLPEPTKAEKKDDTESRKIRRHRRVPSGGMEGEFVLEHYNALPPCGPRLVKLFMAFNLNETGGEVEDTDEERRRWSIDYSSVDHRVPSDKNVPWGTRRDELASKRVIQLSAVWVQTSQGRGAAGEVEGGGGGGTAQGATNTGPRVVQAHDVGGFVQDLRNQLRLSDPVDLVHWRWGVGSGGVASCGVEGQWHILAHDLSVVPEGAEVLMSSGQSILHPIPPALEMVRVGAFHVTNKRDGQDTKSIEFEVALDNQTEATVLWSILHYDHGYGEVEACPSLRAEEECHKLQLVPQMMPQIVHTPTGKP